MAGRTRRVELAEGAIVLSPADVAGLNRYLDRIDEHDRRRDELIARLQELGGQGRIEESAEIRESLEQGRREVVGVFYELRGWLTAVLGRELP